MINDEHIQIPLYVTHAPRYVDKDGNTTDRNGEIIEKEWYTVNRNGEIMGEYAEFGCQLISDSTKSGWDYSQRGVVLHFDKSNHSNSYVAYHTLNESPRIQKSCDLYTTWNGGDIVVTTNREGGFKRAWIKEGSGMDWLREASMINETKNGVIAFNTFDYADADSIIIITPDMKYWLKTGQGVNQQTLNSISDKATKEYIKRYCAAPPIDYGDERIFMIQATNELDVTDLSYYIIMRIPKKPQVVTISECEILAILSEKEILEKDGIESEKNVICNINKGLIKKFISEGLWEFVDSGDGRVLSNLKKGTYYDIETDGIDILQNYQ